MAVLDDATSTVRSGLTNQTLSFTESVGVSLSWTLKAVLPTFQVLGKDYANVVQVDETMTSTTTAGDGSSSSARFGSQKGSESSGSRRRAKSRPASRRPTSSS